MKTTLEGAFFQNVNLKDCTFHNVSRTHAVITNACLGELKISDANYEGMKIEGISVLYLLKC